MKKRSKKERLIGLYRQFKHNLEYKENYFKRIMITLLILLILDLILLYLIWWFYGSNGF